MNKKAELDAVAARVLDGSDIDWQSELDGQSPEADDNVVIMRNLRIVDTIARTLRTQEGRTSVDELLRQVHETFDPLLKSEPVSDEPVPDHWGKLEIRSLLGSGSFANVYRAYDPALQREVALKLFRSGDELIQQRMLEEGRRMARIDHPNVVRVYGAEEHDGRVGIWMELLRGQTLDQLIAEDLMDAGEAALAGREVCKALAAVHAAGIIHSDIKTENVIRREDGGVRLTDFGSGVDSSQSSTSSRIAGTPMYLAPEVLAGNPGSIQSDVYSLGILLFHLVSRQFPVQAESIPQLKQQHDSASRVLLVDIRPDIPMEFVTIVERATAADPAQRYQSMGELGQALSAFLNEDAKNTKRSRPTWVMITGLAILALVIWFGATQFRSPTVSATGYQLETALYRVTGPGAREILTYDSHVALGDQLSLQLTSDTDLFVYIFNEDDKGNAYALYPLSSIGHLNPLSAGIVHNLPSGSGEQGLNWQVDTAAGMERIHIVTSPQAIQKIAQMYEQLPAAQLVAEKSSLLKPRGVGALQRSEYTSTVSVAPLSQAIKALSGNPDLIEGVYYQVIELKHR